MSKVIDRGRLNVLSEKAEKAATLYCLLEVRWKWPGASRQVKGEWHEAMAQVVGAERPAVRASTELFDWSAPALKTMRALRREVSGWIEGATADWIEDGARLLPLALAEDVELRLQGFAGELRRRAHGVDDVRAELLARARDRRGKAFSLADYPDSIGGLFDLTWAYRPLTVPPELGRIAPAISALATARQLAELAGALSLNEEALLSNLQTLVGGLIGQLTGKGDGGKPRIYEASLTALQAFCDNFSEVILWGADEIEDVVAAVKDAVGGVDVQTLRGNLWRRLDVSAALMRARDAAADLAAQLPASS